MADEVGEPARARGRASGGKGSAATLILAILDMNAPVLAAADSEDTDIALSLADLLRAARTVISANQEKINDPSLGDKGLSGGVVVEKAIQTLSRQPDGST